MRMIASWWDRMRSTEYKVVAREPPTKSSSITLLITSCARTGERRGHVRDQNNARVGRRVEGRYASASRLTNRAPYKGRCALRP